MGNTLITKENQWLIDAIIEESKKEKIGDDGHYDYDNGTRAYYSFATLLASYEEYQNFFAYNIYFTSIPCDYNNNTTDNINETINKINTTNNNTIDNQANNNNTATFDLNIQESNNTYTLNKDRHIDLVKHKTGNNIIILIIIIICVLCIGTLARK